MADTKISALTSGNPAQSGDEIPIARAGANYKITAGSIASLATVSPAGSDTFVQFNDGGAFGAEAGFAYNKTTNTLAVEKTALGTAGSAAGVLTLAGSTSGVVTLQTAAAAGTYSLTLPTSDGASGEVLTTDGAGVLSWAASAGGSPGGSSGQLQYNNAGAFGGANFWQSTNIIEQRNSTSAQTLRVYNTYTDASNYERAKIAWESNILKIGTEKAGTGSTRNLQLHADGVSKLEISPSQVTFNATVNLANNTTSGGSASVAARTADGTEGSSMVYVTNRGATATVTRTLQTYVTPITFRRIEAQAFRIKPSTGKSFRRLNGTLETADKYLELASVGATILVVYDGTEYQVLSEAGTITVEP